MAPVVTVSRPPAPAEAFELYPGRWVAIREGQVVADAATLEDLFEDENVSPDDAFFRVPREGAKLL